MISYHQHLLFIIHCSIAMLHMPNIYIMPSNYSNCIPWYMFVKLKFYRLSSYICQHWVGGMNNIAFLLAMKRVPFWEPKHMTLKQLHVQRKKNLQLIIFVSCKQCWHNLDYKCFFYIFILIGLNHLCISSTWLI